MSLLAGLGAGTLVARSLDTTAPVTAVADRVIERVPTPVKEWAISTFGTADKLALAIGIVVILADAAGTLTATDRRSAPIGALAVGVVGLHGHRSTAPSGRPGREPWPSRSPAGW